MSSGTYLLPTVLRVVIPKQDGEKLAKWRRRIHDAWADVDGLDWTQSQFFTLDTVVRSNEEVDIPHESFHL